MIVKHGNLWDTDAPAIGHGVNVYGFMGAGIAAQFSERYEDMVTEYEKGCIDAEGNRGRGELVVGNVMAWDLEEPDGSIKTIYNIASQSKPGKYATEAWLTAGLIATVMDALDAGYDRVAIPAIGCGIGGLHTDALERAVEIAERGGVEFEVWYYQP